MCYVFRGHNVGCVFFTWVMIKQKCQEDNILEAVTEGCQGQLETLKWVSDTSPHGYQAYQQRPCFEALLCSPRPYLPALPLWGASLVPQPFQQKVLGSSAWQCPACQAACLCPTVTVYWETNALAKWRNTAPSPAFPTVLHPARAHAH